MRVLQAASLLLVGCAQLVGIDETHGPSTTPDATAIDAIAIDAAIPIDAPPAPCAGGDARAVDPETRACYVLFRTPMTRNAARTACAGLGPGTTLASVGSAAENARIAGLIGADPAFLSGSDEIAEGQFRWDGADPFVFTNWNTGEPNNGAGQHQEDCIVIVGSLGARWDDRPCAPGPVGSGAYGFVCERD